MTNVQGNPNDEIQKECRRDPESRHPLTLHWQLPAAQEEMRKAGKQEGRNKKIAAGVSSRLLLSRLPAFLNFTSWAANPNDVCAGGRR
jgi:hypothetical protein